MPDYTIRPFDAETDVQFATRLMNICMGDKIGVRFGFEQVANNLKYRDDPVKQNFIIELTGQPIALMGYSQTPSDDGRRRFFLNNPLILPEHHSLDLLDYLFRQVLELIILHNPDELKSTVSDFQTDHLQAIEDNGFVRTQQDQLSKLVLSEFERDAVADGLARFEASTVKLVTLPEFIAKHVDYKPALLALVNAIFSDVPGSEKNVMTVEQFERQFLDDPLMLHDIWMLAMDNEQLVGTSFAGRFGSPDSTDCVTMLTGVLPSHRRQGITTAMKVAQIDLLKKQGFKRVITANEENNPMYKINITLGFKTRSSYFHYAKQITPE